MKHLILYLLRRHAGWIIVLAVLGMPLNGLCLEHPALLFPSCLMTPLILVFSEVYSFSGLTRERAFFLLPFPRIQIARTFWFLGVLAVPGFAALLGLPFLWDEMVRASGLGRSAALPLLRFLYSVAAGVSLSGLVLLWSSWMPRPPWNRFVIIVFMLLKGLRLFVLIWVLLVLSARIGQSELVSALSFVGTVSFRMSDLWKALAGLAISGLSYPVFRDMVFRTSFPDGITQGADVSSGTPSTPGASIKFESEERPLGALCTRFGVEVFTLGCLYGLIPCLVMLFGYCFDSWTSSTRFAWTRDSGSRSFALILLNAMGLLFLFGWHFRYRTAFRALRMLPVSSWRLAACVGGRLMGGTAGMVAATILAACLAGELVFYMRSVLHCFLLVGGMLFMLMGLFLTCSKRLGFVFIALVLMVAYLLACLTIRFASVSDMIVSLSSSGLFTNGLGLGLIFLALVWIRRTIVRNTRLYRLKHVENRYLPDEGCL